MVSVSLSNKSEYQKFDNILNENIINKKGRCLFPSPAFSISGLKPETFYKMFLVLKQVGNRTKTAADFKEKPVQHEPGAATGRQIMKTGLIRFENLRLTNNAENVDKKNITYVVLNSMHKYLPVLSVQEVKLNVNGEWEKVNDEPEEFSFDETIILAVTRYTNNAITELKSTMNKHSSAGNPNKRRREESKEECNQEKRRCLEQENGSTENVARLPRNPGDNNVGRPDDGVHSTSGSSQPNTSTAHLPNHSFASFQTPNPHAYQQQHASSTNIQGNTFASHQIPNLPTNQFNVSNANCQHNNTGFYSSTSVPAQQYSHRPLHSTNANQHNYQPQPYHPNGFPTAQHQNSHSSTSSAQQTYQHPSHSTNDNQLYRQSNNPGSYYPNTLPIFQNQVNTTVPSQPTDINQINFYNYTSGNNLPNTFQTPQHPGNTSFSRNTANANQMNFPDYTPGANYRNAFSYLPPQNNVPTTSQHFDNAVPAIYNPPSASNHLPHNPSQVNYQDPSWRNSGFPMSGPQQAPHNSNQQLQWPPHY